MHNLDDASPIQMGCDSKWYINNEIHKIKEVRYYEG